MTAKTTIERADYHLKIVKEISDLVNKSTGLNTILKKVLCQLITPYSV